jgi:hypothetical protein
VKGIRSYPEGGRLGVGEIRRLLAEPAEAEALPIAASGPNARVIPGEPHAHQTDGSDPACTVCGNVKEHSLHMVGGDSFDDAEDTTASGGVPEVTLVGYDKHAEMLRGRHGG